MTVVRYFGSNPENKMNFILNSMQRFNWRFGVILCSKCETSLSLNCLNHKTNLKLNFLQRRLSTALYIRICIANQCIACYKADNNLSESNWSQEITLQWNWLLQFSRKSSKTKNTEQISREHKSLEVKPWAHMVKTISVKISSLQSENAKKKQKSPCARFIIFYLFRFTCKKRFDFFCVCV